MDVRNKSYLKKEKGTPEWLYYKWMEKFWKAYPTFAMSGNMEPPRRVRTDFIRDVMFVVEKHIQEIHPEISLAGTVDKKSSLDD